MTHTKEPWEVWYDEYGNFSVVTKQTGEFITFAFPNDFLDGGTQEANARRIVACVNALAGYNPDAVAEVIEALKIMASAFAHEARNIEQTAALYGAETALARLRSNGDD